jgi:serine/threonine protein kinase
MLTPGTEIGNYIVEAELARGGMACLFRVRHRVLGTVHALKVLDPDLRANDELRSRFLGEALIGAKLRHPHIVRVTDTIATPEVAGLVMDLIKGPTLEEFINRQTAPLSADTIRELFLPILEALAEAHRAGVVHRDIKPSNILLEEQPGGVLFPKVTDFGIAKIAAEAKELAVGKAATQVSARMGTPAYMSPEQIRGAREVTARSDIFSLGATLYELATGRMAFDGDTDFAIMEKIVHARYLAPEDLGTGDPTIAAAIRKALDPDPERRFASCEAFAAALTGPAPLHNTRVAAHRPARRGRSGLTVLLLLLLLVGLLGGGAVLLLVQLGYELKLAWPPRKKGHGQPSTVSVKKGWTTLPPFAECVAYPRPERVILTRATSRRGFRDADELRYWFRNLPAQSIEVYLEDSGDFGRSVVFELALDRWERAAQVFDGAMGEESCYRLGLALMSEDAGRPMADRISSRGKSLEYEMLGARRPGSPRTERVGTLEEALRPSAVAKMQSWIRRR